MSKKIIISAAGGIIILIAGAIITVTQFTEQGGEESIVPTVSPKEVSQSGGLKEALVALGSSLTRASNLSSDKQGENEEYSFSAGTKIGSLYLYLKESEKNLTAVNLASPGAEMKDVLDRQLNEGLTYNPKYITLDPGADIVSQNSVKDFKKNLEEIIRKINPQTAVFLFTYPNFVKMRTASYQSCKENKVGVNLGNLTENNILAFNQAIKEAVAGKNNVILLDIYNLLGETDVSDYDCLHINIAGQEKIAAGFINALKDSQR